jgi:hypothetical protein
MKIYFFYVTLFFTFLSNIDVPIAMEPVLDLTALQFVFFVTAHYVSNILNHCLLHQVLA